MGLERPRDEVGSFKGRVFIIFIYMMVLIHVLADVSSTACVQVLQGAVDDFELGAIRIVLTIPLLYAMAKYQHQTIMLEIMNFKWIIIATLGFLSWNIGYYSASQCLPLGVLGSGHRLGGAVVVILLLWFLKFKPPGLINVVAIVLCGLGVLLMVQPRAPFPWMTGSLSVSTHENSTHPLNASTASAVVVAPSSDPASVLCYIALIVGFTGASLYVYCIGHELVHLNIAVQLFWIYSMTFIGCTIFALYLGEVSFQFLQNPRQVLLVLAHALLTDVTVLTGVPAMRAIGALRFTICMVSTIPAQILAQYLFLQDYQPGTHNALEVFGGIVVVIGIAIAPAIDIFKESKAGTFQDF